MTDNVFFLGVALVAAFYWVRDPKATFRMRLTRATIMAVVIGLICASFA